MALIGGMVTWSAFKHSSELENRQAIEAGLNREVDETVEELLVRIQAHEQLLLSAAALLAQSRLGSGRVAGVCAGGAPAGNLSGVRAWAMPQWQDKQTAPITRLVPLDEASRPAMAYDLMSDPVRRSALIRARDLGLPVMSGESRSSCSGRKLASPPASCTCRCIACVPQ